MFKHKKCLTTKNNTLFTQPDGSFNTLVITAVIKVYAVEGYQETKSNNFVHTIKTIQNYFECIIK